MKTKIKGLIVIIMVLFALLQIVHGITASKKFIPDGLWGWDFRLRRNEIRCVQQGVNPFHIWNREISLAGFTPIVRPDMEDLPHAEDDVFIHAYTPWHTSMFYFYGWIPEQMCIALMSFVFGLCLYFIVGECLRLSKMRFDNCGLVVAVSFVMILYYVMQCFIFLNYGVLILAALLFMNKMLEKGHVIWAGFAWALMMIKPQVGLLFVWPLFWHRKYWTIVTAAVVCLAATFVTSLLLHESMIDLILQVPKIGAPYTSWGITDLIVKPIMGECASFVVMGAFFILTGFATWLVRKGNDFMLSCVPVALAIPLWTYSTEHDRAIMLIAFLFMVGKMLSAKRIDKWVWVGGLYFVNMVCMRVWGFVDVMFYDLSQIKIVFTLMTLVSQGSLFVFLLMLIYEQFQIAHGAHLKERACA